MVCHRNKLVKYITFIKLLTSLPLQSTKKFFESKLGMFRVTQSSADQPEICKTRHHKHEQTVNKQENKNQPTDSCLPHSRRKGLNKTDGLLNTRAMFAASIPKDAFHILLSAQITHDAPPRCRDSSTSALCRDICRSQHQPWCLEPLQQQE